MRKRPSGWTYTCESCDRSFESEWGKDDAKAEMRDLWGELPAEDQAVICDDCFQRFLPAMTN